jgi:hypothetical protein
MAMIDLGEASHDAPEHAVPVDVPRIRRLALAVVAFAGVLALGGAIRPAAAGVHPVWTAALRDDEGLTLTADTAYLSTMNGGGEAQLAAYDLATGAVRWTVRAGAPMSGYGPDPVGDVVLVPADPVTVNENVPDGTYFYSFNRTTIALDARTGVERWRTTGEHRRATLGGNTLISEYDDAAHLSRLRLVRLADGHELWSRPTPGTASWTLLSQGDRPAEIVTATRGGEIRIYRYADGSLRFTGRLPWQVGRTQTADLYAAGSYLAVRRSEASSAGTTIYRPDDLSELWRTGDRTGFVTACGPLLCSATETAVIGRDPVTGREQWRHTGVQGVRELTPDRLLLEEAADNGTRLLVDAVTGREVSRPASGEPADTRTAPDGSVFLLRRTLEPAGRVAVTRLDVATGRQSLLGTIGQTGDLPCAAAARYLACRYANRLTVTAVG